MKEVSKQEFYEFINAQERDVICLCKGGFPYTSEYKVRHTHNVIAKSVDRVSMEPDEDHIMTDYFINNETIRA